MAVQVGDTALISGHLYQWTGTQWIDTGAVTASTAPATIDQALIGSTDPALQGAQLLALLNNIAMGLGAFDPTTQIDAIPGAGCAAPLTSAVAPIGISVVGLNGQFGVAWALQKTVDNVRGFELERSTDGVAFTSIGEINGRAYIDKFDANGAPFAPSVTRFYRVRAVIQAGALVTFSPYSIVVNATTVDVGTTNVQLDVLLNTWASNIQSNTFLVDTIDKVLGDRLPQLYSFAFVMGGGDRPVTDAAALVDLENRTMAFAFFTGR